MIALVRERHVCVTRVRVVREPALIEHFVQALRVEAFGDRLGVATFDAATPELVDQALQLRIGCRRVIDQAVDRLHHRIVHVG